MRISDIFTDNSIHFPFDFGCLRDDFDTSSASLISWFAYPELILRSFLSLRTESIPITLMAE